MQHSRSVRLTILIHPPSVITLSPYDINRAQSHKDDQVRNKKGERLIGREVNLGNNQSESGVAACRLQCERSPQTDSLAPPAIITCNAHGKKRSGM